MILNHTEKEFISAITTYEGKAKSLAEVLNKSKLLERRGSRTYTFKKYHKIANY
jgi:hypothetical protein